MSLDTPEAPSASNLGFVEELYYAWLENPRAVDEEWRAYFAAWPRPDEDGAPARGAGGTFTAAARAAALPPEVRARAETEAFQFRVDKLAQAYREQGHLRADLDPLGLQKRDGQGFPLDAFGLTEADRERPVRVGETSVPGTRTLRELVARLEETYCRTIGVELAHLHEVELRTWLEQRMERTRNRLTLTPEVQRLLYRKLTEAELFEQFVNTRFLGAKRFSVEGAESLIALLELAIDRAGDTACATWRSGWRTAGG